LRDLYVRKETRDLESIITRKKRENHQIRASSWTRPAQVLHPPWQKAARAVHRDSAPYHAWRWPSTPRRGAPDWPPPPWIRRGPALAQICHGKRAAEGTGGRARHRAVGEVDAAVRARHRAAGEVDAVEVSIGHAVQVDAAGSAPLSLSAGGEREQGRPWPSGLRVGAAPGRRVPSLAATPEKGVHVCGPVGPAG